MLQADAEAHVPQVLPQAAQDRYGHNQRFLRWHLFVDESAQYAAGQVVAQVVELGCMKLPVQHLSACRIEAESSPAAHCVHVLPGQVKQPGGHPAVIVLPLVMKNTDPALSLCTAEVPAS